MSIKSLNEKQKEEAITAFIEEYFQHHDSFTVWDIKKSNSLLSDYGFKYLQNILLVYHQQHQKSMDVTIHPITSTSLFMFHKPNIKPISKKDN